MGHIACFATDNLESLVDSGRPIKVFVNNFTDESSHGLVKPGEFKTELEKSLANRKSIKFEIMSDPSNSDIQISGIIKKLQYLERGPMKFTPSIQGVLLDAAATASLNFVEMEVHFIITDTKTKKILWDRMVNEFKKRAMTPEESVILIHDKMARTFLWKSFGKPNKY
jgi:hypothetical protein